MGRRRADCDLTGSPPTPSDSSSPCDFDVPWVVKVPEASDLPVSDREHHDPVVVVAFPRRRHSSSVAPLNDEELIIGVAWDGEAKAYPITVLRSREMVNDELAGLPTLVTW